MAIASFFGGGPAVRAADRTLFVPAFANAVAFETDGGLVLVDWGHAVSADRIHDEVRRFTDAPLSTVIYTHGHIDHVGGWRPWVEEDAQAPTVVAHEAVARRFERYLRTPGLNEHINRVQFGVDDVRWPREYRWPDRTYTESLMLDVGGEGFELHHGRGETDDATWVWVAERGVLCTGDFWISSVPNCGNPQKVQRYPEEWAEVLEAMSALGAEILLPGHGPPIRGGPAVRTALRDAARYLRSIADQTVDLLNQGLRPDQIVERVRPPDDLASKPYLQPLYDRPEFIVRNVIRLYGGWWDGFAANLLPAPAADRAREIVGLAGGVDAVVARALELADDDLALACHLAEWAVTADPMHPGALECARDVFTRRAHGEPSLMGQGIFRHAAREAERRLSGP